MAEQDFDITIRVTADTAGIKQTEAELRKLGVQVESINQVGGGGAGGAGGRGSVIGSLIGRALGAFSATAIVQDINNVARGINTASDEAAKHGDQIVKNTQKYTELAKAAQSEADVLKVTALAFRDVEVAQDRVKKAQEEELTLYQKTLDSIYHVFTPGFAADQEAGRIHKKALDQRKQDAQQGLDMARQEAVGILRTAEAYKEAFEKRKAQPLSESIEEETDRIKELREQQKAAGIENVESYLAIGKQIEFHKDLISDITKFHKEAPPPGEPRTVEQWREQQAKAMEDYQRTHGPEAIEDWRERQARGMQEYRGIPLSKEQQEKDLRGQLGTGGMSLQETNRILSQLLELWR